MAVDGQDQVTDGASSRARVGGHIRLLREEQLGRDVPLPDGPAVVALEKVTSSLVERAARLLEGRDDARLQVASYDVSDLDFLADLPPLRSLRVILGLDLADVSGLAHHAASLRWLELEGGLPRLNVGVVGELGLLEQLYLRKGDSAPLTHVEDALPRLSQLRYLVLHSVTLRDPAVLAGLSSVKGLVFKLGGNRDLTPLPDMERLRFVELWQVRMLEDLSPLTHCKRLEALYLESLRRAVLPDFSPAEALTHAHIVGLPNAGGVAGIAAAPKLRNLAMVDCRLTADDVEGLRGHPTLRRVWLPLPRADLDRDTDPILGLPAPEQLLPPIGSAAGVMNLPLDDL